MIPRMDDLLPPNARFRLNQPPVIAETIDAEVMIVNLEDGRYYSVTGAGVALWDALVRGSPMAALRALAATLFDAAEAVVVADLDRFVGALQKEGILAADAEADADPPPPAAAGARDRYEGFRFERYDDMRALLVVDPVHEVGDSGWPSRPRGSVESA